MLWTVCLIISLVLLCSGALLAAISAQARHKSSRLPDPLKTLFVGVVLALVALFLPIYINTFKTTDSGLFEAFLISVHNMIRLFVIDADFEFITSSIAGLPALVAKGYSLIFAVLFVLAPLLTFGFALSFFKNVSAYERFIAGYKANTFVFSALNEKSLTLAESLHNNNKNRLLVFADVSDEGEDAGELIQKAKELGAICFEKDILSIKYSLHSKKSELSFFAMGNDDSENVTQALKIIQCFKCRENTNLYVFSALAEAEMLLSNAFNGAGEDIKIKVRRVNEVQSLILRNLYENGYENIFKTALDDGTDTKKINAVVVGMGSHGTETVKALSWFCQMSGYRAEINAFDIDEKAAERFASLCPELMDSKLNGNFNTAGEAGYKITVRAGVDTTTKTFDDIISLLPPTTYAFVALGSDEANIAAAAKLRAINERLGHNPVIQAVVQSTNKKQALFGIKNFKGQSYNIDFIGDVSTSYSEEVILRSSLENEALNRHLKWGNESEFWQFDYNYKSSIASAIHRKMKILCGVAGAEKAPKDRTEQELWNLRILEHCRWNAYMRSEGYQYGGTTEKSGRNDLAKQHNCLVPFNELPLEEQIKDDH